MTPVRSTVGKIRVAGNRQPKRINSQRLSENNASWQRRENKKKRKDRLQTEDEAAYGKDARDIVKRRQGDCKEMRKQ